MSYTISEVATKLSLTKDTLYYYEKEGLLPPIARDKSGHREYSDSDVEWIFLIRCLRDTNMPIYKIKQYVSLLVEGGGNSIPERREILKEHEALLTEKIKIFQYFHKLIEKKLSFFDDALQAENPEEIRCMDYLTEWEQFKALIGGFQYE